MKMRLLILKSRFIEISAKGMRHSQASVKKIANLLGYEAKYNIDEGIDLAMNWYSSKV
jgi:UDP-N-acetylglucosamine 4-epimerase